MSIFTAKRQRIRQAQAPSTREIIDGLRFYTANLVWLTLAMLLFGLFIGYSASSTRLISEGLSPLREIKSEIFWAAAGFVLLLIVAKTVKFAPNARGGGLYFIVKASYWFSVAGLVAVLFTKVVKGSTRTLDLGFIHYQPTEIAKFGLVIYLAYLLLVEFLVARKGRVNFFGNSIPIQLFDVTNPSVRIRGAFLATALMLVLVLMQPDLGSTLLLFSLAFVSMLLGGVKFRQLFATTALIVLFGGILFLAMGSRFNHVDVRIKAWMNPLGEKTVAGSAGTAQADKESYQILQSLGAVANGGLAGKGMFRGVQKINRLPEATNDFIFAVICEELGFFGAFGTVAAFCLLLYFTSMIALCIRNPFFSALVFLIGFAIFLQAIINMGAAVNLFPTTGINLPLISFGSTSRVFTLFQIGLVLAIANTFLRFESPKIR